MSRVLRMPIPPGTLGADWQTYIEKLPEFVSKHVGETDHPLS